MSHEDIQMQNQNHDNHNLGEEREVQNALHQPTQNLDDNEENTSAMTDEALEDMFRYLEARTQLVMKNTYQLLNIYFVFLGALLTAVAQLSSSSECHQRFYFIALSVIPFLLNGVPLFVIAGEYVGVKKEYDRCALERERRRGQRNGGGGRRELQRDTYREMMYKFGLIFAILMLVVFNGVVVFACNSMLCGDNSKRVGADAGCVKVRKYICATDQLGI